MGVIRYSDFVTDPIYLGSVNSNKIFWMSASAPSGADDQNSLFSCMWKSKALDFSDPVGYKRNHAFSLDVGPDQGITTNTTYSVQHNHDGVNSPVQPTKPTEFSRYKLLRFKGAGYARRVQTTVTYQDVRPAVLYSAIWDVEKKKNQVKKST
jgi:hypothetical protein